MRGSKHGDESDLRVTFRRVESHLVDWAQVFSDPDVLGDLVNVVRFFLSDG